MKCIKSGSGEIRRVTDDQAQGLVGKGWNYCPKQEWKDKGSKQEAAVTDTTITAALKKAKKAKKSKEERAAERKAKLAEKAGVPTEKS